MTSWEMAIPETPVSDFPAFREIDEKTTDTSNESAFKKTPNP